MQMKGWKCALALCAFGPMVWGQADITGEWNGVIAGKLRVIFKIEKSGDKTLHGVLESPDEGGAIVPIDEISFDEGKRAFRFEWKDIGACFPLCRTKW